MKSFIKKNIKFIIIVVICITCSVLTTFATDYLFNSSEVYYNNATSGIQADKVQGAIDELYACASNYAAYNQRLTSAENTIGSGSLTTTSQNLIGAVNELNDSLTLIHSSYSSVTVGRNFDLSESIKNFNYVIVELFAYVYNDLTNTRKFTIMFCRDYIDPDVGNSNAYSNGGIFWTVDWYVGIGLRITSVTNIQVAELNFKGYSGVYGGKIYGLHKRA